MEESMYAAIQKAEGSWWYQGRIASVKSILNRFLIPKGPVLDLGAGFGAMHPLLANYGQVSAYEIDPGCIEACYKRGYASVISKEEDLFKAQAPFQLIGAFDVIEHIEDDVGFLRKLRSLLSERSYLVATVPAHQFLWSEYDVAAHHFRRYSKKQLAMLMQAAGLEIAYLGYWNSALFFPAAAMRLLGFGGKEGLSPGRFINRIFTSIVRFESSLQSFMKLPIGLSLIVVARNK